MYYVGVAEDGDILSGEGATEKEAMASLRKDYNRHVKPEDMLSEPAFGSFDAIPLYFPTARIVITNHMLCRDIFRDTALDPEA